MIQSKFHSIAFLHITLKLLTNDFAKIPPPLPLPKKEVKQGGHIPSGKFSKRQF